MLNKIDWKLCLRVVTSLGVFTWLLVSINWRAIGRVLTEADSLWLLVGVVWIIISMAVSVCKWRIVLRAQGLDLPWREMWRIYWIGLFFNNFLPSSIGGDAMRIIRAGSFTGDMAGATTSVVVERILATTGLSLVGLLAGLFTHSTNIQVTVLFIILTLASLMLLCFLLWGRIPSFFSGKKNMVIDFLNGIIIHGERIRKKPSAIAVALFWSVGFQVCVVCVNYAVFCALHLSQLTWLDAMYVVPATSAAAMLPLGINGYGIREGAYVLLLSPYGVNAAGAFAASIIFAFLVSLCSFWGGWIWLTERKKGEFKRVGIESF